MSISDICQEILAVEEGLDCGTYRLPTIIWQVP